MLANGAKWSNHRGAYLEEKVHQRIALVRLDELRGHGGDDVDVFLSVFRKPLGSLFYTAAPRGVRTAPRTARRTYASEVRRLHGCPFT